MPEKRWSLVARSVVGGLVLLESLGLLFIAAVTAIVGSLLGGLAFVAGAGGATDKQVAQGFAAIALTIASPFLIAAVLGLAGVLLILRLGRPIIVAAGLSAIAAQTAFQVLIAGRFYATALVPYALHVALIVLGFAVVPRTSRNPRTAVAA
jgi:hypothetical protein